MSESHFSESFQDKIPADFLIFFAVKEEAAHFDRSLFKSRTFISGMGRNNASKAIHQALAHFIPRKIFTCGFAGGLNPELKLGTVIFEEDFDANMSETLTRLGASPAKFYCSKRVAVTTAEKRELFQATRADAVEMESSVIRNICKTHGIPSATIRVVLDTAHDNLPLDFNALMTSDERISMSKLVLTLLRSPRKIPELISFQKQTVIAAQKLGALLNDLCLNQQELFEKE